MAIRCNAFHLTAQLGELRSPIRSPANLPELQLDPLTALAALVSLGVTQPVGASEVGYERFWCIGNRL